jgi:hypothetical protein
MQIRFTWSSRRDIAWLFRKKCAIPWSGEKQLACLENLESMDLIYVNNVYYNDESNVSLTVERDNFFEKKLCRNKSHIQERSSS